MTTQDELRQLITEHGLDAYADDIMATAQPAIRIERTRVADDAEIPIGASKLGGSSDVPPDFVWPEWNGTPLTFLAQFRLADIATLDTDNALPHTGHLYFFYEADKQPWETRPDEPRFYQVLYVEAESRPLTRILHPEAEGEYRGIKAFPACVVTFSAQRTLPDLFTYERSAVTVFPVDFPSEFDLSDEELNRYWKLQGELSGDEPQYRLLGFPNTLQGDMRDECEVNCFGKTWTWRDLEDSEKRRQIESRVADWRLLLQFDTDDGDGGIDINWCLTGTLYFWIRKQDLAARAFDKTWFIMQCT